MEIGGDDKILMYEGPLSVDYENSCGSSNETAEGGAASCIFLTAGPLCLELCPERNCIAAAPGVFMLSSDDATHFHCLALGLAKDNANCVTKMHFVFKDTCYFQASIFQIR